MQNVNLDSGKELYQRLLIRAGLAVLSMVFFFCILPRMIHLLMPFIIAFVVAAILNPFVNLINQKLGVSRRIIALILDLLFFLMIASLAVLVVSAAVNEAVALTANIQLNWNSLVEQLDGLEKNFTWLLNLLPPQVINLLAGFEENIAVTLQNASKSLLSSVISVTTTMTTKAGSFFISLIMAMLAAYFMIADYHRITVLAGKYIGKRTRNYLALLKDSVLTALGGYLKSQLILSTLAFLFLFAALAVYGQPYALLAALFLSFVDLLPIVGTTTVLVPWGIIEIISGDPNKGLYLIIINLIFFLIRRVLEPKIVGSQTGLHPLAALISTYVGLQFSGLWGAVLGPLVLMLIMTIVKSGIFDNTSADVKAASARLSKTLSRAITKAETES